MILVPSESRSTCERLLAIRIGTFVGSIARMGPSVAGKRTAVTEPLIAPHVLSARSVIRDTGITINLANLGASLTMMRLFTGVDAFVNSQS